MFCTVLMFGWVLRKLRQRWRPSSGWFLMHYLHISSFPHPSKPAILHCFRRTMELMPPCLILSAASGTTSSPRSWTSLNWSGSFFYHPDSNANIQNLFSPKSISKAQIRVTWAAFGLRVLFQMTIGPQRLLKTTCGARWRIHTLHLSCIHIPRF